MAVRAVCIFTLLFYCPRKKQCSLLLGRYLLYSNKMLHTTRASECGAEGNMQTVPLHQTTLHHMPGDHNLHGHYYENVTSHSYEKLFFEKF
jgi:hypothetical protein